MSKKQLNQDEISWQKVKLIEGGGKGLQLKYCYIREVDGFPFVRSECPEDTMTPHDDLVKLIKSMRILVAKVENIDYARRILDLPGYEPTQIQIQLTEATVQNSMEQIEVTGVSFSERHKDDGVIISYTKTDLDDKVIGHSTTWIQLNKEIYGVEEDLADICKELKREAYEYEFNEKHAKSNEPSLFNNRKKEDKSEVQDAEIIEETNE